MENILSFIDNIEISINISLSDYYSENSDLARINTNHLLIQTYTFAESTIKEILRYIYQEEIKYESTKTIIYDLKYDNETWTPKIDLGNLKSRFSLLKNWYFIYDDSISLDTMIQARHEYAHKGSHTYTFDMVIFDSFHVIHLINFLNYFYVENTEKCQNMGELLLADKIIFGDFMYVYNTLKNYYQENSTIHPQLKLLYAKFIKKMVEVCDKFDDASVQDIVSFLSLPYEKKIFVFTRSDKIIDQMDRFFQHSNFKKSNKNVGVDYRKNALEKLKIVNWISLRKL